MVAEAAPGNGDAVNGNVHHEEKQELSRSADDGCAAGHVAATQAQQAADPRIADIVRAGKVRIGLHLPQFVQDKKTGEIRGNGTGTVIVPIAQALAERMGVKLELVGHPAPPALIECLKAGNCDVGFLGFTEAAHQAGRLRDAAYHGAVHLSGAGRTRRSVPLPMRTSPASASRPCATMPPPMRSQHVIKHAKMIEVAIPDEAFELIRSGKADAYASPRPPILEYAKQLPGSRVLDGHYGANIQAFALNKGQAARLAYVSAFVEEARTSGVIQKAIDSCRRTRHRSVSAGPDSILTGTVPGGAKH